MVTDLPPAGDSLFPTVNSSVSGIDLGLPPRSSPQPWQQLENRLLPDICVSLRLQG